MVVALLAGVPRPLATLFDEILAMIRGLETLGDVSTLTRMLAP